MGACACSTWPQASPRHASRLPATRSTALTSTPACRSWPQPQVTRSIAGQRQCIGGWTGSFTAAQPAPVHPRSAACMLASPRVQLLRQASLMALPCAGHRRYPLAPSDSDSDERAGASEPAPSRQGAENALLVWRFQYAFTPFPETAAAAACTAEEVQGGGEAEAAAGGAQLPAAAWGAHAGAASGGEATEAVARTEGLAGAVQAAT